MTIAEILQAAPKRSRDDAVWLLSSLLRCSKADVFLNSRDELSPAMLKVWRQWWKRRERGEPMQYICGSAPFFGREFAVDKRVLIPRPETERLVEISLELLKSFHGARVLDIGTGCGAIALTIKAERPDLAIIATDISAGALKVARANAKTLGLPGDGLRFERHDLFAAKLQRERWDLVVSNPPYLDFRKDRVAADVKRWEPRIALVPALSSKTSAIKERAAWCADRILAACAQAPPRFTGLELSPRVAALLEKRWRKKERVARVWREADLAGKKRFLLVAWENG